MKVWYKFDGDFNDSSGNGYNASIYQGAPITSTTQYKIGKSAYFTSDSLKVDGFTLHNKSFAVSVWSYAIQGGIILSQQKATATNQNLHIRVAPSGNNMRYDFHFWANDLSSAQIYPDLNTWVHLVFQIHSNGHKEIWRNGVLITNATGSSFLNTDNADLVLGNWNYINSYYGSYMDDFRIYNKALTATEIGYLANNMVPDYKTLTFPYESQQPTLLSISGYASWDSYKAQAEANGGGRLPYRDEIIALLNGDTTNNYLINDTLNPQYNDIWIPVNDYIGAFIEIGDYPSHGVYTLKTPSGTENYYENGVSKTAGTSTTSSSIWGPTNPGWIPKDRIYYFAYQTPYTLTFDQNVECDILIVAGGGGGGRRMGGGGGAGALIYDTFTFNANTNYTIKVGKGGDGVITAGNVGENSGSITAQLKTGGTGGDSGILEGSTVHYRATGGGGGAQETHAGDGGSSGGSGGKDGYYGGLLSTNNIVNGTTITVSNNARSHSTDPSYDSNKIFGNEGGRGNGN